MGVDEKELAWAAGFYEGEGCIGAYQYGRRLVLRMSVVNTDPEPMQRFYKAVGVGYVTGPNHPPAFKAHWKPRYVWQAQTREAIETVVKLLYGELSVRRQQQIDAALTREKVPCQ